MQVLLDGKPIPDSLAGPDVHGGTATISSQRLYRLVDLPHAGRHLLSSASRPGSPATRSRSASRVALPSLESVAARALSSVP